MLLNFSELVKKYNIQSKGVIIVGAHFAEEHNDYVSVGIPKMVYIEPCRKAFDELQRRLQYAGNVKLFNMACGDKTEVGVTMYTGDNTVNKGQSNSLLRPALHKSIHPEVEFPDTELVDVEMLDKLGLAGQYDFLVMDVQGYEGFVLRGATETLKGIKYVYTEANQKFTYEGNTLIEEIDALLSEFERVETGTWVGECWTDCLYVRKSLLS